MSKLQELNRKALPLGRVTWSSGSPKDPHFVIWMPTCKCPIPVPQRRKGLSSFETGKYVSNRCDRVQLFFSWSSILSSLTVSRGNLLRTGNYFFLFEFHFIYFLYSRFLLVIYFIHISIYTSIPISQFITPPPPRPATFPPWYPYVCSLHLWTGNYF